MPYYLYTVTTSASSGTKSLQQVAEFDVFRTAKNEAKRLRTEQPLEENSIYKIIFADTQEAAEKSLKEHREEPIAREWEK
jgi:hypothetical protein